MTIDWSEVWRLAWPILKEMLVALLMALLTLLGYDRYVPSRLARRSDAPETGSFASGLDMRLRTIAEGLNRRGSQQVDPGRTISENMTRNVAKRYERAPDARRNSFPPTDSGGGRE
jgi:hypothetical protein